MNFWFWLILVIISFGAGFLLYLFLKKREKEYISKSLNMSLFMVTMPKYDSEGKGKDQRKEKMLIGQMEQVLSNFIRLKKTNFFERLIYGAPRIALEIASQIGGKDISFFVAIPQYLESSFEKFVQGVYERAVVEKVSEDYTIFEPNGKTAGCYMELSRSNFLPISTYKKLEKDPLAAITNSLSKIKANEGAAIQIVAKPSVQSWQTMGSKIIEKLKKGKSFKESAYDVHKNFFVEVLEEIFKIFFHSSGSSSQQPKERTIDEETIKLVQEKTQKPVFDANIRILTSAADQVRADEILRHIESSFGQFGVFAPNSLEDRTLKGNQLKRLIYDFSFRNFNKKEIISLNIEELASVFHFPTFYIETPYIKLAQSTESEPPDNLPEEGFNLLGEVNFRGEKKEVKFATRADRRRHFYMVGQTGTGKSGFMTEMIRHDLESGEGVGIIDPHGDLIEDTLANIPKDRINDVIIFDPSDTERPVGLNMLECENVNQKDFAIQEMIALFYKLFQADTMGPIFEHAMRNGMMAVMADQENPGTLVELSRIFKDDDFLDEILKKVQDPMVKRYWLQEWKNLGRQEKSEYGGYVTSKLGRFIENEMMRNIIGQRKSAFDFSKIMDEKKIFLAKLPKGVVGEMNISLLGLILISKLYMAAMKRNNLPEDQRQDFYLYIDEFQNFTTDSISSILSEARKYRLNMIMGHQYIPQLKDEIRDAVFGNVGTIAALRVGADDAEFLEKQFEPSFSRFDLVNLENYHAHIKMILNNQISKPFKMSLFQPKKLYPEQVEKIKEMARLKYGKPKEIVGKRFEGKI
jgi:hypothetical protein